MKIRRAALAASTLCLFTAANTEASYYTLTTLDVPDHHPGTVVYGVDNSQHVAGSHDAWKLGDPGFMYSGGIYTTLANLDSMHNDTGSDGTYAASIIGSRQIVGRFQEGSGIHRCVTSPVPVPAAAWLFGSGLFGLGLIGLSRSKDIK